MKEKKIALVTGGIKGIGKAIVKELLKNDYHVYTTFLSDKKAAIELEKEYANVKAYQSNVSSYDDVKKVVNEIVEKEGHIDALINNAGITNDKTLFFMTEKAWKDVIDTNLNGVFFFTRAVGKVMAKIGKGSIVNISSISSKVSIEGQSNYSASKAGIEALTRVAAKELAVDGVRINSVSPGFIETSMTKNIKQDVIKKIPIKRMGTPEEVANAVMFLLSDKSVYITGQNIIVDGGLSL